MPDELIDIYDAENRPTGQTMMKSVAHREGLWHRAVSVFFYDTDGNILLQKRSMKMTTNPGKWGPSAAGHVAAGETPEACIMREVEEEIGIVIHEEDLGEPSVRHGIDTYPNGLVKAQHKYIFFVEKAVNLEDLSVQESEVCAMDIFPVEKVERMLEESPASLTFVGEGFWEYCLSEIQNRVKKPHRSS